MDRMEKIQNKFDIQYTHKYKPRHWFLKLNLDKTKFYHLVPEILGTKKHYRPRRLAKVDLNLTKNFSANKVSLHQLDPNEWYKILGILTEPNDTNAGQIERMHIICRTWNSRMLGSSSTPSKPQLPL